MPGVSLPPLANRKITLEMSRCQSKNTKEKPKKLIKIPARIFICLFIAPKRIQIRQINQKATRDTFEHFNSSLTMNWKPSRYFECESCMRTKEDCLLSCDPDCEGRKQCLKTPFFVFPVTFQDSTTTEHNTRDSFWAPPIRHGFFFFWYCDRLVNGDVSEWIIEWSGQEMYNKMLLCQGKAGKLIH